MDYCYAAIKFSTILTLFIINNDNSRRVAGFHKSGHIQENSKGFLKTHTKKS